MSTTDFAIIPKIIDIRSIKPFHAHVMIEPLQRGYGHTLGNALRRVMMSSIPGFAVTKVKIDGVVHEYDRVEGLREDVVWLLLNLKAVVFRIEEGEEEAVVTLKKEGPGPITANDITLPHNVTVLNGDHVLGLLTEKGKLDMEITVQRGVGYEPAAVRGNDKEDKIFGEIHVDALYSPVRRVAFQVENARVANRTDLDRLILDIETNGILEFEDIIRRAADILIAQFSVFTDVTKEQLASGDGAAAVKRPDGASKNPMLIEEVDKMELTVRSKNCLRQVNIRYIGELVQKTEDELMHTPHLGRKSLLEIQQALGVMDLSLGMVLTNWTSPRGQ